MEILFKVLNIGELSLPEYVGDQLHIYLKLDDRYFISAVEGLLDSETRSFAIVGDSITDGRGSTTNKNNR